MVNNLQTPVDKIINVLELLASEPGGTKFLTQISREASVPPASCARMLKSLVRRGYAEKNGPRGGYRLGPMAYALTGKGPYMKEVFEAAAPEVQKCAEFLEAHVLLGAARGDMIYKIAEFDGNPEIRVRSRVVAGLNSTATGILVLAFSGERAIDNYINLHGIPAGEGGMVPSLEEFKRGLAGTREKGYSLKITKTLAAFAFPVKFGHEYLGLGCSVLAAEFKGEKRKNAMESVRKTADNVSKKLERSL